MGMIRVGNGMGSTTPAQQAVQAAIAAAAPAYGVPANIALAVAKQESGFSMAARGAAGEVGVYQLMPRTAAGLGVDPYNQAQNIQGGLTYLSQMYAKYGNWDKALAAYNAGPGNVDKGVIPASTRAYVQSVIAASQTYLDFAPDPGALDAISATAVDTNVDPATQEPAPGPAVDSSGEYPAALASAVDALGPAGLLLVAGVLLVSLLSRR